MFFLLWYYKCHNMCFIYELNKKNTGKLKYSDMIFSFE